MSEPPPSTVGTSEMCASGQRRPDLKSRCQSIAGPRSVGPEPSKSKRWASICSARSSRRPRASASSPSSSRSHAATVGSAGRARSRRALAGSLPRARSSARGSTCSGRTRSRARRSLPRMGEKTAAMAAAVPLRGPNRRHVESPARSRLTRALASCSPGRLRGRPSVCCARCGSSVRARLPGGARTGRSA